MDIINDLANIFIKSELRSVTDNFSYCEALYGVLNDEVNDNYEQKFNALLCHILDNHLVVDIEYKFENQEHFLHSISEGNSQEIPEIKEKIQELIDFSEGADNRFILIKIYKKKSLNTNNELHVFNFNEFANNVENLSEIEFLEKLSEFDLDRDCVFTSWDTITSFNTSLFSFKNVHEKIIPCSLENRTKILDKRNKSCHFTHDSLFKFYPDEFLIVGECIYPELKNKFDSLLIVFSLIFISDYSEFYKKDNGTWGLIYKLRGYRLISDVVQINEIDPAKSMVLFDIYEWIYNQGNFVDKIGLARNIISIHTQDNSILNIPKSVLKSIESSFDIYLKDNVKQYIEIKNKISEFVISQNDKASDITKNMFSTLKTSFWSIITFFISVFLVKIVTDKSFEGIITKETLIVTFMFLIFSEIYLLFSSREVDEEKKRLLDRYDTIYNRYKDLLNKDDLNTIINTADLKSTDELYIDTRKIRYNRIWRASNILVLCASLTLFGFSKKDKVIEWWNSWQLFPQAQQARKP
ncbi:hypothetical protein MRP04_01405 [Dickeya dianthicola]|uniref:hypothetical protein n=1 Tax=Dickeya dianthicola TaxID=204039 RepID=UPI001F60B2B6|nr:hypothetical protein [Dickeya dianthicola]MCI4029179.1 hypothetical protein [Dickeya dianthicola]MCI4172632.1 hypothetical protein [Dickeya dianthicola]MCI4177770.1 hypothetical protein [Dickeya dianthicola]MCI4182848.1 hypothetical protein [Dickeya dianthicola]MCI4194235.1 hypothetical protein [Dickeya dianthicola]